jgi:dTDP-4-amino-4,6-dideoxygalactose transaminase/dienelactone hydrolase
MTGDRIIEGAPHGTTGTSVSLRRTVARLVAARPGELSIVSAGPVDVLGLTAERYVFAHLWRSRMEAVLLAPPGGGRLPAVLVSAGQKATLGRVTGLEPPDHPDRNVAEQLARAGFVTLTLDYGLTGDPAVHQLLTLSGRSLVGALTEDAVAALGWLSSHPRVDPDRMGLFGHSLGAAVVLHTALVLERPVPVCAASHLGTYPVLYGRQCTGPEGGALPGILRYADLPDLFGALAPAPLQVQFGLDDPYLDPADAAAAGEAIETAYAAVDRAAKEQVEVLARPMGHGTAIDDAVRFFTRALAEGGTAGAVVSSGPVVPAGKVSFDVASRLEIADRVDAALASGSLTLGRFGRHLEELAEPWTGATTVAVASGSAALEIALRLIGVSGRTVLVPANTFFATAASAIRAGAEVDFVDLEPDGLGVDPASLREALDRHADVAAVVVVHIAGVVSPAMAEVAAECARRGVEVVEDAAHALGSAWNGRPAGSLGRLAAFSLYPTKVATSGEGGLISCARPADADAARCYRDQGKASFEANVHAVLGSNWRMSEVHAAVGIAHLERLGDIVGERRALAAAYDDLLGDVPRLRVHRPPAGSHSNYYKYVALLDDGIDRDRLRRNLRERHGVALSGGVYDTLVPDQPYFADRAVRRAYPGAERFASRHICLPLFNGMTREQQLIVVRGVRTELGRGTGRS